MLNLEENFKNILILINFLVLIYSIVLNYNLKKKYVNNDLLEFPKNYNLKKKYVNNDLLEFPKNYNFEITNVNKDNILYKVLDDYIKRYKDYNFIVSLSGGVDSMVLLYFLLKIVNKKCIAIASINYNQRDESEAELKFLEKYLLNYNLILYSKTVLDVFRKKQGCKRKDFEETSQNIRYELYNKIIKDNGWTNKNTIILLGHHLDDLRENIFTNFMSGRKLIDLEVMNKLIEKNNLIFGRPFLDIEKREIYNLSHTNNIPYFKDTTPKWSKRGLMRNKLFPLIREIYSGFENNLDKQGKESSNLKNLIINEYIENIFSEINVSYSEDITILSWTKDYDTKIQNPIIWHEVLCKILHQKNLNMISNKSFKIFLKKQENKNMTMLSKNVGFRCTKENIFLILKK